MIAVKRVDCFTEIEKALIRSVLYFDIFNYPITADEARAFAPFSIDISCDQLLDSLVSQGVLFKDGGFYSVKNDAALVARRLEGNRLAAHRMRMARKYSRLIAAFPFVRAVMLSGSISKNFMDENSDIDYFIVTETKRLWILRTMLAVFRRIFLFNSRRNFCVNYFVDTDNLEIPDRNIFVATELVTLKPMYGETMIKEFFNENRWIHALLPQASFDAMEQSDPRFFVKELFEKSSRLFPMDAMNYWLLNFSVARWKRKYSKQWGENDFQVAFRSKEGVSKSHPRFFQKRALDLLETKIKAFEFQHGIDLML